MKTFANTFGFLLIMGGFLLVLPILHGGQVYGQESLDDFLSGLFGSLGPTNTNFGFKTSDTITVTKVNTNTIDISIPVIMNTNEKIKKYSIWGSNLPMDDFDNFDAYDVNSIIDQMITLTDDQVSGTRATLRLTNLSEAFTYYATITPIAGNGDSGIVSNEFSFSLGTAGTGVNAGSTTNTSTNPTTNTPTGGDDFMGAGGPNMRLANVSYTQDKLALTITWTSLAGADSVQISYTKVGGNTYTVFGTPRMNDQRYVARFPDYGTYILKLTPLDAAGAVKGTEFTQTVVLSEGATTPVQPANPTNYIPTVPKVGPEDHIPAIILISIIGYLCWKLYQREVL